MGTGRLGNYLHTAGKTLRASQYAVVHSNEGTFTNPTKKGSSVRLKGGGHGEDGITLLKRYKIDYNITHTYANGVRVGNIPTHKDARKRFGSNQSWFPSSWNETTIKRAGEYVMSLKRNKNVGNGVVCRGRFRNVTVGVILTNGKIGTIFPDKQQ